jgi:hypothetical protein
MESSRRDGYDGYFTWGGALLQPELWGIHPKIAISGHKPPIFTRDIDLFGHCFYYVRLGAIWTPPTQRGAFAAALGITELMDARVGAAAHNVLYALPAGTNS